jgi:hypothetical protein
MVAEANFSTRRLMGLVQPHHRPYRKPIPMALLSHTSNQVCAQSFSLTHVALKGYRAMSAF